MSSLSAEQSARVDALRAAVGLGCSDVDLIPTAVFILDGTEGYHAFHALKDGEFTPEQQRQLDDVITIFHGAAEGVTG